MTHRIPLLRPYFDSEELKEIEKVLSSGWVSQGPEVKEFETRAAEYLGVRHAIAVINCTSALHLSLLAMGIQKDDEVLVADFTFPATGHAVLYCGATPMFVDVDMKTYNLDPALIEEKITEKTKAIIPVHTFGQPASMDEIMHTAQENGLPVIEDAACAFGATYKGTYAGMIGDIGCFSFHARKGMTTGEGGMVVTNDSRLADKIRMLSVFGMVSAWDREESSEFVIPEFIELGYNYKLSDINAAVGVVQLRRLNKIIERKQQLAQYWNEILGSIDWIEAPYVSKDVTHIYQSYVVLVDKRISRNKLITILKEKGVQAQIGTYASHIQPVYNSKDSCPHSLEVFERSLALPMYYALKEEEIDTAASCLKASIEELK